MASRVTAFDWDRTPLGHITAWSNELAFAASTMMRSGFPAAVAWGSGLTTIYNDAFRSILGSKHPKALGSPLIEIWREIAETVEPIIQQAMGGTATFLEDYPVEVDRSENLEKAYFTFSCSPIRSLSDEPLGVMITVIETTSAVIAREEATEAKERQAFLLKLSDALRPLADPPAIDETLTRLVGERLGADWVVYGQIDENKNIVDIGRGYSRLREPPIVGEQPLSSFGWAVSVYKTGTTLVISDTQTSELISAGERPAIAALGMVALISVPLLKNGELVGALAVSQASPRNWTDDDIRLAEAAAERIWAVMQRARSDGQFQTSEKRFQQFAEASSDVLWIRDAKTFSMEFLSRAFETVYGVPCERVMGDVRRWAALIVPDDRKAALAALDKVRDGQAIVHEFRILHPSDGSFHWIRNTDFPLFDEQGGVQRIAGIASNITRERLSVQHHEILLAELQHRVRNILAMIKAVAARTAPSAENVEDYAALLSGRLAAMARTQSLLTHSVNDGIEIDLLVRDELAAQAQHEGQYRLQGPKVVVSPKTAEVLALAVHELATNALKHGALAVPEGQITIEWAFVQPEVQPRLRLRWLETRPASQNWHPPTRRGFGTVLIEDRVPYELRGSGELIVTPEGVEACIEFPLVPGASILETHAPVLTTVSGGSIDMTRTRLLPSKRILVVEDDFYLASDLRTVLQSSGASVAGPFPTEDQALEAHRTDSFDAAVLDINLGSGPSFVTARALHESGTPFIFLTGYDASTIPEDFAYVPIVQKPTDLRIVVQKLSGLLIADA